ncbi:MAG: TetR/AcrR family transcriptional regulator [Candidatus Delongbacteria bacterium]|nr:TetR/AcrR family transcriptional regulator [Candidatus Delongbacteria bacterium]
METISLRQKEILEVAIKILAQEGIQNLTIKNISKSIGFTEAALYRHYDSKHKILFGILDLFEDISTMPEFNTSKNLTSIDKLNLFILDRYKKFTNNPDIAKTIFSEAIFINDTELSSKIRNIMRGNKKIVEKIIISGQKKGEINNELDAISIFRTITGSMRLLVTQWCYNDYSFDLQKEGIKLWDNIKLMISSHGDTETQRK